MFCSFFYLFFAKQNLTIDCGCIFCASIFFICTLIKLNQSEIKTINCGCDSPAICKMISLVSIPVIVSTVVHIKNFLDPIVFVICFENRILINVETVIKYVQFLKQKHFFG